jgi:cytochrome b6-f complex iron-sulfur subunit
MNLNRRKLLSWFGLGWLASLLPSSLIGCSEATTTPTASSPAPAPESVAAAPSGSFKAIGTVAQLDKAGSLLSDDKQIAVVRDPQDAKKLLAVNPTCTHNGCTVAWTAASKEFLCPCHDAKFGANGAVNRGPADKPLKRYIAKIENGQVLVSV